MSHYKLLVDYGITPSADKWDKVVKCNNAEKIDIYWRDSINPGGVMYKMLLNKMGEGGMTVERAANEIDAQVARDLSVISHILSHFIGYKPDMKKYEDRFRMAYSVGQAKK